MKVKSESNFSKQFVSEFMSIKTVSEEKDRMIASLMQRIAMVEKCLMLVKQEAKKNYNNMCQHNEKWKALSNNFETVSIFMDKLCEMQAKIDKLSEENLKLESTTNMLNIEMAESQFASQNAYKVIEDRRVSELSSPRIETRSTIEKPSSTIYEKSSTTSTMSYQRPSSPIEYSQYVEISIGHKPTSS